jgi:hypothetical protein
VLVPEARRAINECIRKERALSATGLEEGEIQIQGTLRAVHLDQDWLEVTVVEQGQETHIRITKAGEAIDDVVGPMLNHQVTIDTVKTPDGKHLFRDIQPVE